MYNFYKSFIYSKKTKIFLFKNTSHFFSLNFKFSHNLAIPNGSYIIKTIIKTPKTTCSIEEITVASIAP